MRISKPMKVHKLFSDTTGMPIYDKMAKDPEYFKEAYGMTFMIVDLKPQEYLDAIAIGFYNLEKDDAEERGEKFPSIGEYTDIVMGMRVQKRKLAALRRAVKTGIKFSQPYIEFRPGCFFVQEGHHRALLAKELGYTVRTMLIFAGNLEPKEALSCYPSLYKYATGGLK